MRNVHALIGEQIRRSPDAIAVRDHATSLTYRELDARANAVARSLITAGVRIESRVGVYLPRGVDMVVALLGILRAGAAYVPIDLAYPRARVDLIVRDASLAAVVTQRGLPALGVATVFVEGESQPVSVDVDATSAIYVLYTSGSTGQPKGVVGEHRAVLNRLHWQQQVYPFAQDETASARTPLGFVDSVAEIFAPLAFGVPLVVLGDEAQRDIELGIHQLAATGATRIVMVPSLLATMLDVMPDLATRAPALHYWFVGGEPVPVALVERFKRELPGKKLINIYGATELTADATYYDFDAMPPGLTSSPIGIPLTGCYVRIVDDSFHEVPDDEVGEVVVSGECVARGYLERPDLTAERFITNPFPEGGLIYRTRDLGKRLPTGDVQYLGRLDSLVKIRGMRVELGEVEALVGSLPGVVHTIAVARDERLVVFFTASSQLAASTVRAHVAERAPAYLVPTDVFQLDTFPLNANGKVDRALLRSFEPASKAVGELPVSDDERFVASVWELVLGKAPIGRAQSFFDLGGSSLGAMRIITRLREHYGVHLPVVEMYQSPTVAALTARVLGARKQFATRIELSDAPLPATMPLSDYQLPFWFFRAITNDTSVVADVFALPEPVDIERLQRAFSDTVAQFDALWMRYPRWRPVQEITPRRETRLMIVDGSELDRECAENVGLPWNLDAPPHIHARLVGNRLAVAIPHIAVDMASLELFRRVLEARYVGRTLTLSGANLDDLVRWEQTLTGEPTSAGSALNAVPAQFVATRKGDRVWSTARVSASLLDGLRTYARDNATSLPVVLVGAIYAALGRTLASDDPTLIVMIDKRDRAELRELFTNLTGLVRCQPGAARAPVRDVARRVATRLLESAEHSDLSMRYPTQWNDFWADLPRAKAIVRKLVPRVAELLFAIVPVRRADGILIAVNVLPEVTDAPGSAITRQRDLHHMLRRGDLLVGTDKLLDKTLQIHVTRDDRGVAVNLYGGRLHQRALDTISAAIVDALHELAAVRAVS